MRPDRPRHQWPHLCHRLARQHRHRRPLRRRLPPLCPLPLPRRRQHPLRHQRQAERTPLRRPSPSFRPAVAPFQPAQPHSQCPAQLRTTLEWRKSLGPPTPDLPERRPARLLGPPRFRCWSDRTQSRSPPSTPPATPLGAAWSSAGIRGRSTVRILNGTASANTTNPCPLTNSTPSTTIGMPSSSVPASAALRRQRFFRGTPVKRCSCWSATTPPAATPTASIAPVIAGMSESTISAKSRIRVRRSAPSSITSPTASYSGSPCPLSMTASSLVRELSTSPPVSKTYEPR